MPYALTTKNGLFAVENTLTGHTHGWTTEDKAKAQLRILEQLYKPKCLCVGKKTCPN